MPPNTSLLYHHETGGRELAQGPAGFGFLSTGFPALWRVCTRPAPVSQSEANSKYHRKAPLGDGTGMTSAQGACPPRGQPCMLACDSNRGAGGPGQRCWGVLRTPQR